MRFKMGGGRPGDLRLSVGDVLHGVDTHELSRTERAWARSKEQTHARTSTRRLSRLCFFRAYGVLRFCQLMIDVQPDKRARPTIPTTHPEDDDG